MLTSDQWQSFDWSPAIRRIYYGRLKNIRDQMMDMQLILEIAQRPAGFLDIGLRDRNGNFWLAVTRPGMPVGQTGIPRRDLDLIEYLMEWGSGVKNHALVDLAEMEGRYPELRYLKGTEIMPAKMIYRRLGRRNWLKRALKWIFG